MWPDEKANPIGNKNFLKIFIFLGNCVSNSSDINAIVLFVEFDTYTLPVVFPTELLCIKFFLILKIFIFFYLALSEESKKLTSKLGYNVFNNFL